MFTQRSGYIMYNANLLICIFAACLPYKENMLYKLGLKDETISFLDGVIDPNPGLLISVGIKGKTG